MLSFVGGGISGLLIAFALFVAANPNRRMTGRHSRESIKTVDCIEFLREEEGDSVTINSPNPDFDGGPDHVVECSGDWSDWDIRRFGGNSLLEALELACAEKVKRLKENSSFDEG